MLPDLNEISTCQSAPIQYTLTKFNQFLYCKATHPLATIQYHARNIILMTDADAVYFVLPSDRSRIAGHYYLNNRMINYSKVTLTQNSPILTEFKTLKTDVSSSAESKTGVTFENDQNFILLRHLLKIFFTSST